MTKTGIPNFILNTINSNKDSWKKKKENDASERKIKNKIKSIELKITETENEIDEFNTCLVKKMFIQTM